MKKVMAMAGLPLAAAAAAPAFAITRSKEEFNVSFFFFSSPTPLNDKRTFMTCSSTSTSTRRREITTRAIKEKTNSPSPSPDEVTQKYGLEAALWKIFSSKEEDSSTSTVKKSKGEQAKELLTKYGGAYLATSITLSFISFSLCYALITAGVDVQSLLLKLGISANQTGEKVGTFALAYAAHKAASPIRFPPTVALTPIVATWIGKKPDKNN